jgi:probable rRNA maturation factor
MIDIIINREAESWESGFEEEARRAATAALTAVLGDRIGATELELGLTFADDETVRTLNRDHRGQDKPTNVLSFPLLDAPLDEESLTPEAPGVPVLLGDVILAWETVAREAQDQGKSVTHHALHLVIHGVLHVLGHDHETETEAETMEHLEIAILHGLGIPDPYGDLIPTPAAPEPP